MLIENLLKHLSVYACRYYTSQTQQCLLYWNDVCTDMNRCSMTLEDLVRP